MNTGTAGLLEKAKTWGFQMTELMRGEHEFVDPQYGEGKHFMEFEVDWGPEHLGIFLDPGSEGFMRNTLSGTVTMGGLCESAPCQGTLDLQYHSTHKIRYTFEFEARGKRFQYVGEKVNIRVWNLATSHTTCFGTVVDMETGALVSRSVTRFLISTIPSFLSSFSLTRPA